MKSLAIPTVVKNFILDWFEITSLNLQKTLVHISLGYYNREKGKWPLVKSHDQNFSLFGKGSFPTFKSHHKKLHEGANQIFPSMTTPSKPAYHRSYSFYRQCKASSSPAWEIQRRLQGLVSISIEEMIINSNKNRIVRKQFLSHYSPPSFLNFIITLPIETSIYATLANDSFCYRRISPGVTHGMFNINLSFPCGIIFLKFGFFISNVRS